MFFWQNARDRAGVKIAAQKSEEAEVWKVCLPAAGFETGSAL